MVGKEGYTTKPKKSAIHINRNSEKQYVGTQLPQNHSDVGNWNMFIIDHNSVCDLD